MPLFQGDVIQLLSVDSSHGFGGSKFQIGHCYSISDYTCTVTDRYQRFTRRRFHINVGRASKISHLADSENIPRYWFNFASIDYLQTLADKEDDYPGLKFFFP